MLRMMLPTRPWYAVPLIARGFEAYRGGEEGYVVGRSQAQQVHAAVAELTSIYVKAMDVVISDDKLLDQFVIRGIPKVDRRYHDLFRWSWENESHNDYILDRWDLAWDGINPPKLLERNFGALGLIPETGPVQADYINWVKRQKGFEDVGHFADFGKGIKEGFHKAAVQAGLAKDEPFAFPLDLQMYNGGDFLAKWMKEAGYNPITKICGDVYLDSNGFMNASFLKYISGGPFKKGRHTYLSRRISESHAFLFVHLQDYIEFVAETADFANRKPVIEFQTHSLMPFWTMLMHNKAMLPVLYEMFPDHPNLLPAYMGENALRGEKRVTKLKNGAQGSGAQIYGSDDKPIIKIKNLSSFYFERSGYITQAYSPAVEGPDESFRVCNVFSSNGKAIGMSVRESKSPVVGVSRENTETLPVLVRTDSVVSSMKNARIAANSL